MKLIYNEYHVLYSLSGVTRLLRDKFNAKFGKPYPHDFRRNKRYKSIFHLKLYQKLRKYDLKYDSETGNIIDRKTGKPFLIFSFDEAAFQFTSNYLRVWSLTKPQMENDSTIYSCKMAGFYSLTPEGNDHITLMENATKETIVDCLKQLIEKNSEAIIFILIDNFSSHKSTLVKKEAKKLGIELCFLPTYSPQFQPVEKIWLHIKKIVNQYKISKIKKYYEMNKEIREISLQAIVVDTFYKIVESKTKWNSVFNDFIRPKIYNSHPRINSDLKSEIVI